MSYWAEVLGLQLWFINLHWEENKALATATSMPEYKDHDIYLNPKRIKDIKTHEELEELLLHELCHYIPWTLARHSTLKGKIRDYFEEEATTLITRVILRAREQGREEGGGQSSGGKVQCVGQKSF